MVKRIIYMAALALAVLFALGSCGDIFGAATHTVNGTIFLSTSEGQGNRQVYLLVAEPTGEQAEHGALPS
jgi:hypothetical protein